MSEEQNQNQMPTPSFEPPSAKEEKINSIKTFIWETVKVIIISLIIILPVRYYIIQPFYVQGASMEPNFFDHEYLIIDEISYRLDSPARGDIVVFRYPKSPDDFFIKRIIGLPGERIKISNNQIRIFNQENPTGFVVDETSYLPESTETFGDSETELGDNQYYVLGDNRSSSLDSRSFGPVDRSLIIGKTWVRGWPISRFTIFEQPVYNQ